MASFLARLVVVQRERELLNGPPAATIAGRRPGRVCVSTAVVMCVVATRGKIGWLGMSRGQWQVVESKGLGAKASSSPHSPSIHCYNNKMLAQTIFVIVVVILHPATYLNRFKDHKWLFYPTRAL